MLEIRYDDRKLKDLQRTLAGIPNAMPRVMSRGLNRTADQTRTQLSRLINQHLKLGVRTARKEIYVHRASYGNWRASVQVANFRADISLLNPKQTSLGVTYRVGKKTILLRHAFIATGKSKGRQVWLRSIYQIGYRKYIEWQGRTMEALYTQKTAGAAQVLLTEAGAEVDRIYAESQAKLEKNIHDQVQLILRRRAG